LRSVPEDVVEEIGEGEKGGCNPLEVFKVSLDMEIENTTSITGLYELALKLKDHATKSHLQWFLDEQVEEEKSMEDIIALLERIGEDTAGLLYLNDKLGQREEEQGE
jgi:ferritin